jgi:hypothetical protein
MRTSAGPFGPASAATVRCTLDATATPQANKHVIIRHRLAFADPNLSFLRDSILFLLAARCHTLPLCLDMATNEFDNSIGSKPANSIFSYESSRILTKRQRPKRSGISCQVCHQKKIRCIFEKSKSCMRCIKKGLECDLDMKNKLKLEQSLQVSCCVQSYQRESKRETKL